MTRERLASSVARHWHCDHVRIAFRKSRLFCGVQVGVHADQDRELACRRQCKATRVTKFIGIGGIRREHLVERGHADSALSVTAAEE